MGMPESPANRRKMEHRRILLRMLCVVVTLIFLVIGLWPFRLQEKNNLGWHRGSSGLQFGWSSIVYSRDPLAFGNRESASSSGAFSLEVWLMSLSRPKGYFHSILSVYDGETPEQFRMEEYASDLFVRTRAAAPSGGGLETLEVKNCLPRGELRHIVVISSAEGAAVYVNGTLVKTATTLLSRGVIEGTMILGSSAAGGDFWMGRIYAIAAFDRGLADTEIQSHYRLWKDNALDEISREPGISLLYLFKASPQNAVKELAHGRTPLVIPDMYRIFRPAFLGLPWEDGLVRIDVGDIAANTIFFIFLGFLVFRDRSTAWPEHPLLAGAVTLMFAAGLSFLVEMSQAWMPSRFSSLSDLLSNISGAVLGVLLAGRIRWFRTPPEEKSFCVGSESVGAEKCNIKL